MCLCECSCSDFSTSASGDIYRLITSCWKKEERSLWRSRLIWYRAEKIPVQCLSSFFWWRQDSVLFFFCILPSLTVSFPSLSRLLFPPHFIVVIYFLVLTSHSIVNCCTDSVPIGPNCQLCGRRNCCCCRWSTKAPKLKWLTCPPQNGTVWFEFNCAALSWAALEHYCALWLDLTWLEWQLWFSLQYFVVVHSLVFLTFSSRKQSVRCAAQTSLRPTNHHNCAF